MSSVGSIREFESARAMDRDAESGRLWRSLAHPFQRTQPARGFDVLGERIVGTLARRRARTLDWARAESIISAGKALASHSAGALAETIAECGARAAVAPDDLRVVNDCFAVSYEVIRRDLGLELHPVQVLASLAMAAGCCAELATGEGKTVTAILPAALRAWSGRGVHLITVNDYLARRDAELNTPAFKRLGLTVGVLQDGTPPPERRAAYGCSVTYAADKQVIFDHLRDRLVSPLSPRLAQVLLEELAGPGTQQDERPGWTGRVVQRGLHCAIIDEADSVLIDEAVTPAIIASEVESPVDGSQGDEYRIGAELASALQAGTHYAVDHRLRHIRLTDAGRERLAVAASDLPAFWSGPRRREELILQALSAKELFTKGDDYIISDGKVLIVDRSTGRMLPGRQWQLGLHQAVEAKEGIEITDARRTTARVSYQQFFQRYQHLAGMSGTVQEVEGELWRTYRLPVVAIPTNRPIARERLPDRFFPDQEAKFNAVADRVMELHSRRQPVLIGTRSVESSERLGRILESRAVACSILNATREKHEAEIIAQAGQPGAITVATNMAGRGTDIRLGPGVRELGGLAVIATERHDEARVDRQLFGRSGRQGDPGLVQAFVALDDQLIVTHGPRTLTAACRAFARAGGPLARLLWWLAQAFAGRKATVVRAQVGLADAWMDVSLHHRSR